MLSSKMKIASVSPRAAAAGDELDRERRLAGARRRRRAACWCRARCRRPAACRARAMPLGELARARRRSVLGGDEAREDLEAAPSDDEVVIAAAVRDAAELERRCSRRRSAPYSGVSCSSRTTPCAMLCSCRSWLGARHVVEQQHRAVAPDEELLERQDLPAVAQRIAGEQPHLRQRVEDDARRACRRSTSVEDRLRSSRPARPRTDGTSCTGRPAAGCLREGTSSRIVDARRATSRATPPRRAAPPRSPTA